MNDLLLIAQIAGRRCAFPAQDVQSAIEIGIVTPVPSAPAHIAGITAMRSQTLTVIDCRRALGFDPGRWSIDHRAIVVMIEGHPYALRIDSIEDITSGVTDPELIPGGFGPEWSRVASGLVETLTGPALLIDLPALIADPDTLGAAA